MDISDISAKNILPPTSRQLNTTPAFQPQASLPKLHNASELASTEKPPGRIPSEEELQASTKKVQEFVNSAVNDIEFSIDEDSGQTVVKIVDRATKNVIRQMPSEEMLELAEALDKLQGLFIKQKA